MLSFSLYFFVCFVAVGAYASWLGPYLDFCGVSAAAIGYSFGIVSVLRAATPPFWGLVADRLRKKHLLLVLVTVGAGLTFIPLFLGGPPSLLFASTLAFGVFFAPLYPLLDAQVLGALGAKRARYGRIRLFGSLGFLVVNFAVGPLVSGFSLAAIPWLLVAPLLVAAAIATTFPTVAATPPAAVVHVARRAHPAPGRIDSRRLAPILAAVILVQASHSPYWAYFATSLGKRAVSADIIGLLLATAVAAEIAAMALAPALIHRFGAQRILEAGLACGAARWLVSSMTSELWLLWPSQLMHAGSYAMVYVAAVTLVDEASPTEHKAFGQTVLSACSHGIGLGGGFLVAGALVDALDFQGLMQLATVACVAGAIILRLAERAKERQPHRR